MTAEAQTATTLVSNTGQSAFKETEFRAFSQRFTTGSNEDGYTLTGVDVVSASSTDFTAQVCGVDSDTLKTTSTCTDLMPPGTFAVGTMSFTAPADTLLTKSTTYAVVVTALATNTAPTGESWTGVAQGWGLAVTGGEDADRADGWSLSDDSHVVDRDGTLGSWRFLGVEFRIAIKGAAGVLGLAAPANFTAAVGNAQAVLSWTAPASGSGLTVEANARTLIAHEDSDYREWGAGGSVRLGPDASGRGLSLALAPVWGTPSSGVERLWSARDAAGLAPGGEFEAERRLEAELGYGLGAPRGLGLVTPYAGLSLADGGGRAWRLGARWQAAPDVTFGLEGTRREPANDDEAPRHGLMLRGVLRW